MYQTMEVSAVARVEDDTEIRFLNCGNGDTEFTFDKAGLILETSERGLHRLAEVVNAAVRDRDDD